MEIVGQCTFTPLPWGIAAAAVGLRMITGRPIWCVNVREFAVSSGYHVLKRSSTRDESCDRNPCEVPLTLPGLGPLHLSASMTPNLASTIPQHRASYRDPLQKRRAAHHLRSPYGFSPSSSTWTRISRSAIHGTELDDACGSSDKSLDGSISQRSGPSAGSRRGRGIVASVRFPRRVRAVVTRRCKSPFPPPAPQPHPLPPSGFLPDGGLVALHLLAERNSKSKNCESEALASRGPLPSRSVSCRGNYPASTTRNPAS